MTGVLGAAASAVTGGIWKYVTIGISAVSAIALVGLSIDVVVTKRELSKEKAAEVAAVQRAALDEANIATLKGALNVQNAQIDALAQKSQAEVATAGQQVQAYQGQNADLRRQLAALSKPLTATTPCARMDEADKRILEDLQ